MTTRTLGQKLKSTKLWLALTGVALGAVLYLGGDPNDVRTIAGVTMQVISIISYIVTEGKIDIKAVTQTIEIIGNVAEAFGDGEEDEEAEEQTVE